MKFLLLICVLCVFLNEVSMSRMVSKTCQSGGKQQSEDRVAIPPGQYILKGYCAEGHSHKDCDLFCIRECRSGSGGCGNGGSRRPDPKHCYCEPPYSG